jgi:hypothetical protein
MALVDSNLTHALPFAVLGALAGLVTAVLLKLTRRTR